MIYLPGGVTLKTVNTYDLLPSQMGAQQVVARAGEETGAVWCPMKMSRIAVMRCAEYQEALGCGTGCKHKATPGQIKALSVEREQAPSTPRPRFPQIPLSSPFIKGGKRGISQRGASAAKKRPKPGPYKNGRRKS